MGGQTSSVEEKTSNNVIINHPKFKQIQYLQQKDIIRAIIHVGHEQDFYSWESKLQKITDLDDQVILLPKAYAYTAKAICGPSGTIKIDFDNYPYVLSDQLKNRRKISKNFDEPQVWYLLYSLITAAHDFRKLSSKVGDIRPHNIFINEVGQIKVTNLYSFPSQSTNYIKTMHEGQKTYLSPQEIESCQNGQHQTYIDKHKAQAFSIGITALETASIRNMESLYPTLKSINKNYLDALIKDWWVMKYQYEDEDTGRKQMREYSGPLKVVIASLCQINLEKRADTEEIYQWLKKFHKEINELRPFQPGMPPLKDLNRYTQNLSSIHTGGGGQPYPNNNNHHQSSHQQYFNQYANQHSLPQGQPNLNKMQSHGQHNHQAFFHNYSAPTQPYKQQTTSVPNYGNTMANNNNVNSNIKIGTTNSVITTVHNTTTKTSNQQGFSYQAPGGSVVMKYNEGVGNNFQGMGSNNYGGTGSGQDFLKKIDEQLMKSKQTFV